ncbi:hypothetical protein T03_2644 [Trichinella britovi]|uniref:Uncharacterized protein n=2 Tax=Trichinella TaxID=6333 RepID=A0A0V1DFB2_TRIBR|nr:hypothetical protein T05_2756 [Trichinella murrelli]KRX84665.1 hypothetical protein T06_6386 [Trichinella sp. T6]KRY60056.1 hypothetical protein T03_2644 [Trichinella britovi]
MNPVASFPQRIDTNASLMNAKGNFGAAPPSKQTFCLDRFITKQQTAKLSQTSQFFSPRNSS